MAEEPQVVKVRWHDITFACGECEETHEIAGFGDGIGECKKCGTKIILHRLPKPASEQPASEHHIVIDAKVQGGDFTIEVDGNPP